MVLTGMDEPTAGAGPIDTVYQAAMDFNKPEDWAMDGVALGLDTLGFIANPLGSLLGAGIGWLIEHLEFLKEPLDDLAGDPGAIFGVAAVWGEQVRKEVGRIADDYQKAIQSEITSWSGDAADSYRRTANEIVEQIRSLDAASAAVAEGVKGSGQLVATVRGIIRDLIADVVAEIIIAAGAALATSWCSFGGSIAAFIGWSVARGAATAGKIAGKISKLLMKLANILSKFSKLRGAVQALGKLAKRFGDVAKTLGKTAGRHGKALRQIEGKVDDWNNKIVGRLPDGLRDTAGKVDDMMTKRPRDGFADTFSADNIGRTVVYEAAKENAQADENYDKEKEKLAEGKQ
ncbi:hypothetical protein SAMN05421810_104123 [Amycolatopsis arida]|uniref:WXG100 family type VII secretion target n=2 Tax=Amycolatopsis arida TaxID=587909 RepID=A0A1I5UVE6_9PSEU|nr:hypothetical protein CLV69_106122 [Amycolatopsis arida]SFP99017.1 hypothetical protein SAMN05421810_104123 [Amycolatopsis arida]